MGTKRIDQFPAATLPLAGSELIPLWQSSATVNAPASALTTAGPPGSVWRDGAGAPSNALGVDGDYYLDDNTGLVYRKAAGVYTVVANITGPTGATGPQGPSNLTVRVAGGGYLMDNTDDVVLVDCSMGNVQVTLPDPSAAGTKPYRVKRKDQATSNFCHLLTFSGNIDFQTLVSLQAIGFGPGLSGFTNTAIEFVSDGTDLWITAAY